MLTLKKACESTATFFRRAQSQYAALQPGDRDLLPRNRRSVIEALGSTALGLETMDPYFDARSQADLELDELSKAQPGSTPDQVVINKREYRLNTLRLFRAQVYLLATWSVYDSLWDLLRPVLGPSAKPKFVGGCLTGNDSSVGTPGCAISRRYGFPAAFSYAVRNELAHRAGRALDGKVFEENSAGMPIFQVTDSFLLRIETECKKSDWAITKNMTSRSWPWSKELDKILRDCTLDIDTALVQLMSWSRTLLSHELAVLSELSLDVPRPL